LKIRKYAFEFGKFGRGKEIDFGLLSIINLLKDLYKY